MNFEATPLRIATTRKTRPLFANLATVEESARMHGSGRSVRFAVGRKKQDATRAVLLTLEGNGRYMDRAGVRS